MTRTILSPAGALVLGVLAVGCNDTALGGGGDLAAASSFCSGAARVELGGMRADSPLVKAALLPLSCCEAAEISVVSMQIAEPLVFSWRHFVGSPPAVPTTIDLANVPTSWNVTLTSGCTSSFSGCQPTDTLTHGLTGTLTIGGDLADYEMSLCLTAHAPADETHPVLREVKLWTPTLSTRP